MCMLLLVVGVKKYIRSLIWRKVLNTDSMKLEDLPLKTKKSLKISDNIFALTSNPCKKFELTSRVHKFLSYKALKISGF